MRSVGGGRKTKYDELETQITEWCKLHRKSKLQVNYPIVKEQAEKRARILTRGTKNMVRNLFLKIYELSLWHIIRSRNECKVQPQLFEILDGFVAHPRCIHKVLKQSHLLPP